MRDPRSLRARTAVADTRAPYITAIDHASDSTWPLDGPVARSAPPQAHRRRRQVCVLFADITGFTRLVESVEPEVVYGVVGTQIDELVALIHPHIDSVGGAGEELLQLPGIDAGPRAGDQLQAPSPR
jgi:class 3 adenylate cyclase